MDPISKEAGHAFNLKLAKKCIQPIFTGGRNKLGFNVPKFLPNLCRGIVQEVNLLLVILPNNILTPDNNLNSNFVLKGGNL